MMSASPSRRDDALLASMARGIDEVLGALIPRRARCALLDFPTHGNLGDSAIWLGQKAWLRRRSATVVYTAAVTTCDPVRLARRLGRGGIILLSGGGMFGDLYPHHERFREAIVSSFPGHRIVQLPQTIWFVRQTALARARAVFARHPDLTILARDHRSLRLARNILRVPARLCPDLACALEPLHRPSTPQVEVLWLLRKDQESRGRARQAERGERVGDWSDGITPRRLQWLMHAHRRMAAHPAVVRAWPQHLWSGVEDALATMRVEMGCRMLSRGKVVVTDRLHGHLLCLLLGIPHVLLDNSYGKNRSFYETWTAGCASAGWAESQEEAQSLARLLAELKS